MFKLANANKPDGRPVNDDKHQISLQEVKQKLGSGAISLDTHEGQLLFGKALIHEAWLSMRSARFGASLSLFGFADKTSPDADISAELA